MGTVVLNIALSLLLVNLIGYEGLALGTSIAALVNALALLTLLNLRIGGLDIKRILTTCGKVAVASFIMGLAASVTHSWLLLTLGDDSFLMRLSAVIISIGVAVLLLILTGRLLKLDELDHAWHQLLGKLNVHQSKQPLHYHLLSKEHFLMHPQDIFHQWVELLLMELQLLFLLEQL